MSKCAEALLMSLTNNTCKSVFFFIPKDIADAIYSYSQFGYSMFNGSDVVAAASPGLGGPLAIGKPPPPPPKVCFALA